MLLILSSCAREAKGGARGGAVARDGREARGAGRAETRLRRAEARELVRATHRGVLALDAHVAQVARLRAKRALLALDGLHSCAVRPSALFVRALELDADVHPLLVLDLQASDALGEHRLGALRVSEFALRALEVALERGVLLPDVHKVHGLQRDARLDLTRHLVDAAERFVPETRALLHAAQLVEPLLRVRRRQRLGAQALRRARHGAARALLRRRER